MNKLNIENTPIDGLFRVHRKRLGDNRGYFERLFCTDELAPLLAGRQVKQFNHTRTEMAGVLRGMHFQRAPAAEAKLITCIAGKVHDVVVDIRQGSSTFLQHYSVELSADEPISLWVPEGFAHGFQTLLPNTEMLYAHTAVYSQPCEGGLDALDPALAIQWPLHVHERSIRDTQHPPITSGFQGITP